MQRRGGLVYGVVSVLVAGTLSVIFGGVAQAQQWQMVYNEEFTTPLSNWKILQQNKDNYGKEHLAYSANNVAVTNGSLQITTRRHCVSSVAEPLGDSNASQDPCPSGKMTRYQSGRVESGRVLDGHKPFRVEVRAKINWNGENGTRPAIWLRNSVTLANCSDNKQANDPYGELDILEWYSWTPTYTWSTTHIRCYHSPSSQIWKTKGLGHSRENLLPSPVTLANDWHVWATEYDGETVKFFVDNQPVLVYNYRAGDEKSHPTARVPAEKPAKMGMDVNQFKQVFDDTWYVILNDYVEWKSEEHPPDSSKKFANQTFLIDYVKIYQSGAPTTGEKPPATPPEKKDDKKDKKPGTKRMTVKKKKDAFAAQGPLAELMSNFVPALLISLCLLLIALAGWLVWWWRRRRQRAQPTL